MFPFDDVIIMWLDYIHNKAVYVLFGIFLGLILGLRPANERRRYFVMMSLIGWVEAITMTPITNRNKLNEHQNWGMDNIHRKWWGALCIHARTSV